MTFNSLICKIFEQDKNNDVTVENIVSNLFYVAIAVVIVTTFIYGSYLNLTGYSADNIPLSIFVILKLVAKGLLIALSVPIIAGVVLIIWYEGSELWNKIKNKPVAHCHVKKEEDENNEL